MEKLTAIQILNSRSLLTEVGVEYPVKVTNVTPFQREDGTAVNILNFNAMTPWQAAQAKLALKEGNYQEATNFNISSSSRIGIDFTPVKGQNVYITLAEVKSKSEPDTTILVVQSVRALDKAKGRTLSFDDVEEAEEAPMEEVAAPAADPKAKKAELEVA